MLQYLSRKAGFVRPGQRGVPFDSSVRNKARNTPILEVTPPALSATFRSATGKDLPNFRNSFRVAAATLEEASAGECSIAFVDVDNHVHDKYTQLSVEVQDYPGLLRVVAWVLNGMGMRVHNAVIKTTEDGVAQDEFWLTDLYGRKLSDATAEGLVDRIREHVGSCQPDKTIHDSCQAYICGDNLEVNNGAHPYWSQVVIKGEPNRPGFLLEIASIMSGMGFNIHEAEVQGSASDTSNSPRGATFREHDFSKGRIFIFWVTDRANHKLDYPWVSALTYTLGLVLGKGHISLTPPNMNITAAKGESCAVEWTA